MKQNNIKKYLGNLYLPSKSSHKGQNGRLLIIGGSHLFHSASLWALEVASRIVDLVHYSSIKENNEIVQRLKVEFRNGIIVPRPEIESYIEEDDCILIGPGMVRADNEKFKMKNAKLQLKIQNLNEIEAIGEEGLQTYYLTKYLLRKYPKKKWVIDAGALQMLDPEDIPGDAVLTPHMGEFENLKFKIQNSKFKITIKNSKLSEQAVTLAKELNCIILLKGEEDIVASGDNVVVIQGGNAGMTKGGTGDVLAGLVAGLYCRNDAFTSAVAASYINKKSGDDLFKEKGYWFNASDLAGRIPETMRKLLL